MKIFIMRHGETDFNQAHRLQGQKDIPLNENGRDQARLAGEEFRQRGILFNRVISSPLFRARETAKIVSRQEDMEIFNSLMEIDFGRYEGIKYEDIDENMRNFFHDPQKFIPMRKMESYTHLFERISHFLDWLKQLEGEGNLLILSHGAAIHAMMNQIYQLKLYDFWKQPIGNCGYFVVEIQDGQFRVVEENFRDGKNNYLKK